MGGPASSVVAEIYMQEYDKKALLCQTPPKAYERFVDDTFSIIKRTHLQIFFDYINSLHPKTQFTIAEANDGSIPFLDTLLKRNDDGSISVLVYRKPTHTDQYLNFNSNHQTSTKDAVISALFRRARDIVSDVNDLKKENDRIVKVLSENDYDKKSIFKVKRKIQSARTNNITVSDNAADTEPTKFLSLPYIPGTSESLRRILASHKIKCAFYSKNTLRKHLSKPKDAVPQEQRNNIVYKIPCKDCDATYIGESKRSFKVRSSEHMRAVRNMDIEKNEIADHCWKFNHEMNWNNKKVIDTEPYVWSRKIKETIHSINDTNHINSISYNLPEIWHPNLGQHH